MKKLKGFNQPINTFHDSKKQLGNTLVPVIIALAISAIASVSFLKKGGDLSAKADLLEAQYELAEILKEWNILKSSVGMGAINPSNFPSAKYSTNIYGGITSYSNSLSVSGNRKGLLYHGIPSKDNCEQLYDTLSEAEGVSQTPILGTSGPLPYCDIIKSDYQLRLPLE